MNSCQKVFSACLLALLAQAAFAQSVPQLGGAASFAVLSAAPDHGGAVTCTDSTITGDVGSSGQPASIVQTNCTIEGAVIAPVSARVLADFNGAYDALAAVACSPENTFTSTSLGDHTFTPGVYCFSAAVTETSAVWTLDGGANDLWQFKIGTEAPGALTGTSFSVVMADSTPVPACNVTWWVDAAATMTDSDFKGTILAGAAITDTGGTFEGSALAKAAVTLTGAALVGCEGARQHGTTKAKCNQGVGNGPEDCDPGNSNQGNPFRSNDELGGTPGNPGRQGGNK